MQHGSSALRDDRGTETAQWVMMGALMIMLIAVVFLSLNHNAQLRAAVTRFTEVYATSFGQDMQTYGPEPSPFFWHATTDN